MPDPMTPAELRRIRERLDRRRLGVGPYPEGKMGPKKDRWRGLTQQELADQLGVNKVSVARWELGLRPISPAIAALVRLLAAGHRIPRKGGHET